MEFSRQESWSGLAFPPSDPGMEPMSLLSPALAGRFFTTSATWEALVVTELALNPYRILFNELKILLTDQATSLCMMLPVLQTLKPSLVN